MGKRPAPHCNFFLAARASLLPATPTVGMLLCKTVSWNIRYLPSKQHEAGIQRDGQQRMTDDDGFQWPDRREKVDLPRIVAAESKIYHQSGTAQAPQESELEFLEDLGDFLEE